MAEAAPLDAEISLPDLTEDPDRIYQRLRAGSAVLPVAALKRTRLTRAEDTRAIKANPELFSLG